MTSSLKNMSDKLLNVQSDRKTLSAVWKSLCANYEGTNIKSTIIQLLNMYQPEDGIEAYERLLKTLIVLLKDLNNNDLKNFTSMIPPPIGFSEQITKEIFFNATGFMRIDAPTNQEDYSYFPHETNLVKNKDKSKQIKNIVKYSEVKTNNFVNSETVSVPEVTNQHIMFSQKSSFHCDSFKELRTPAQTVYNQDKNIQYSHYLDSSNHYPSQHYFMKHQSNSLYLPSTSCQKTWSLNQVPLLVKNCNTIQPNFPYRSLLVKTPDNKYLRLPIASCNVPDFHYFNYYQNQESSEKEKNLFNVHDLSSNISQKIIEVPGELNNIEYDKVLKKEEFNDFTQYDSCFFAKEKVESNDEKENYSFFLPLADNILETLTVNKNLRVCIENFLNRLKQDVSAQESINKTPSTSTFVDTEKSSFPHYRRPINSSCSQKKNNLHNELKITNTSSANQTNSINELTAHKQQYYDALLNVQRAKMAVANSLTLSSTQSYGDFKSFYTNFEQQRHWTIQQPQTKTIHESPNCQKLFHPQYSHVKDLHTRVADWNCSSSSRSQQEYPFIHASPMYESGYMYNFPNDTSQYFDLSNSKTSNKRRKLHNTTVKLTKGDTNSMHY